jgi:uncharacterized protein YbaP (TraB family)
MDRASRWVSSVFVLPVALGLASLAGPAGAQDAAPAPAAPTEAPAKAPSKPFLWVVEGTPRIYLFGTIHVPDPRVELTASTKAAFAASDVAIGELSLKELMSPAIVKAFDAPEGKKLADLVPKDVMERLTKYMAERDRSMALLESKSAIGAAVLLIQFEMMEALAQRMPMDVQFQLDAMKAGKTVDGLESAKEQIAALTSPPPEVQARFLDTTIKGLAEEHAAGRNPLDGIVTAYTSGDLDALAAEMKKMDLESDPDVKALMKRLVGDRNVVMVDRLLEKTAADPAKTYFVFVGAAHYAGADGILALLDKKGRKTRRLAADEKIPAREPAAAPAGK